MSDSNKFKAVANAARVAAERNAAAAATQKRINEFHMQQYGMTPAQYYAMPLRPTATSGVPINWRAYGTRSTGGPWGSTHRRRNTGRNTRRNRKH